MLARPGRNRGKCYRRGDSTDQHWGFIIYKYVLCDWICIELVKVVNNTFTNGNGNDRSSKRSLYEIRRETINNTPPKRSCDTDRVTFDLNDSTVIVSLWWFFLGLCGFHVDVTQRRRTRRFVWIWNDWSRTLLWCMGIQNIELKYFFSFIYIITDQLKSTLTSWIFQRDIVHMNHHSFLNKI